MQFEAIIIDIFYVLIHFQSVCLLFVFVFVKSSLFFLNQLQVKEFFGSFYF